MITLDDVRTAADRIKGYVRRTPLMDASLAQRSPLPDGASLLLKLESLQVTGSFKARGAINQLLSLPPDAVARGIVTASGGNHGIAVARAAYVAGVPSTVFLPENAALAKQEKLKSWGATIHLIGRYWDEAHEAAMAFAEGSGLPYFHPFASPAIVAGQGTVALEILEQAPDIDLFLIAIGGGGLIAGMSTVLRALHPNARIIGIEPVGSPTLYASLEQGSVVKLDAVTTTVPTMACARTDPGIFDIVRKNVDDVILLEDAAMFDAARWLWFEFGLAADASGAAAAAALLSGQISVAPGTRICALVCGAGLDAFA
ncbi:pyridoxal-phosphate dependent enzyme [Acidisoma cellulosilytica]|uniref:Pyridoxal-phosphate dependent enzyme n=1 Tax=Acidisoma cellulosilyticum TaxID=2802395 RepID=A0A963Z3H5_9PROT|nr:pyridoxal-phosphate dependent enzyme [Acidisoma cellulosilyticum]MCB8881240.1 pyridoxal-phosphate dependent enzyme [Acidisoma cellulosilyticum]